MAPWVNSDGLMAFRPDPANKETDKAEFQRMLYEADEDRLRDDEEYEAMMDMFDGDPT